MRRFVLVAVILACASAVSAQMGKMEQQVLQAEKDRFAAMVKGPVYAPKTVELVESLPMTPVGKPDKKVLRARYWQGRDRGVS